MNAVYGNSIKKRACSKVMDSRVVHFYKPLVSEAYPEVARPVLSNRGCRVISEIIKIMDGLKNSVLKNKEAAFVSRRKPDPSCSKDES